MRAANVPPPVAAQVLGVLQSARYHLFVPLEHLPVDTPHPANRLNDLTNREWLRETKSFWRSETDEAARGGWTADDVADLAHWLRETKGEDRAEAMLQQAIPSAMFSQAPPRGKLKALHPATFSERDVARLIRPAACELCRRHARDARRPVVVLRGQRADSRPGQSEAQELHVPAIGVDDAVGPDGAVYNSCAVCFGERACDGGADFRGLDRRNFPADAPHGTAGLLARDPHAAVEYPR